MPDTVKVFVSYSHKDSQYLKDDSLLGFLKGLERENVEFWTDRNIRAGELWDKMIKANLQDSHIVLVLISQGFLDSDYIKNVEIKRALAQKTYLFPIILSACEWRRHDWLRSRQFLPGDDQTIEEHYRDPGELKRLFLKIREQIRERVELIRQKGPTPPPDRCYSDRYSGKTKIEFCKRLGKSWKDLADYIGIPAYERDGFNKGDEGRAIWEWLEKRKRLQELPEALRSVDRPDLTELFNNGE